MVNCQFTFFSTKRTNGLHLRKAKFRRSGDIVRQRMLANTVAQNKTDAGSLMYGTILSLTAPPKLGSHITTLSSLL